MKDIAIYGLGGFGREVACIINQINNVGKQWNLLGFFDDGKPIGYESTYGQVIGGLDELNNWKKPIAMAIAIGTPHVVCDIVQKITNKLVYYPNIIAPDCIFFDKENYLMGKGNIISFGCSISCNVYLGDFNIFNGAITIGHDAKIGNYNSLMPATRISGFDEIGDLNYFGVQSVVLQQIKIGERVVLGANSVLMKEPDNGKTYLGNPAKAIF